MVFELYSYFPSFESFPVHLFHYELHISGTIQNESFGLFLSVLCVKENIAMLLA